MEYMERTHKNHALCIDAESRKVLLGAAPTMGADAVKYNVKMLNMYR